MAHSSQYVFLAGAVSGLLEGVSIQPLEMLKTRFQIHKGEHLQLIPTIRDIIREGGVKQLYRGGLPEITGLIPRATAALSTLEFSHRTFRLVPLECTHILVCHGICSTPVLATHTITCTHLPCNVAHAGNSIDCLTLTCQCAYCEHACRHLHHGHLPLPYAYLSGALAGVSEGIVFSPFQVIKVMANNASTVENTSFPPGA